MELENYIQKNVRPDFNKENSPFNYYAKDFKKNEIICNIGTQDGNAYFLKEGIVQLEIVYNDIAKIIDFCFDGSFFAPFSALITQQPSDLIITALTECKVEVVNFIEVRQALRTSLMMNQILLFETQKNYLGRAQREKDLLTKTPEERYLQLLKQHPKVIHQIPIHRIAHHLGIHPESLSRIRKRIIS